MRMSQIRHMALMRGEEKYIQHFGMGRDHLKDLSIQGRIILQWILKTRNGSVD
jgi:hypothetical protein